MHWNEIIKIIVVISVTISFVVGIIKLIVKNKKKKFTINEYNEIKKRIRIAWIENDMRLLPLKELEADLFSITHIKKISKTDLDALFSSSYEIVILDIKDVAPARLLKGDGLGLLEQLKQKTPQTYVMVCTGERFDADEMKILNNADDLLSKTAGYTEIKDKLEKTIKINFFYKDELNKIFAKMRSKIPSKKQKTVFSLIEATCVSEISSDELRANLESLRITASCIRDILKSIEFLYLG